MMRLLLKIALHGALAIITVGLIEYCLIHRNPYEYYRYGYDEVVTPTARDNIIIGASHATHGINPGYMATHRFYNFALNGASPSFTLTWYKHLLSSHKNPKLIIYEVNWFMFDSSWLWRRFEHDARYLPKETAFELFTRKDINRINLFKGLFFVFDGGDLYRRLFYPEAAKVDYATWHDGFIAPNYTSWPKEKLTVTHDPGQLARFVELMQLIKGSGTQLVFVQVPEYLPGRNSLDIEVQNRLLQDLARRHEIPFLNYNDGRASAINYRKEYFADWGHLNREGSTLFSQMLDADLNKLLRK